MNKFDELNGYYDGSNQELHGFLSKINKKFKKVTRKVRKAVKKITPKPLRKIQEKIEAEGRRMDRKGITKKLGLVAAGVATAWFGGPAIIAGLKAAGGSGLVSGALGAAKSAAVGIAKTAAAGAITKGVTKAAVKSSVDPSAVAAYQDTARQVKISAELAKAMGSSPEFTKAVQQYRAEGYSDEEILKHWVESKTYYAGAVTSAAETIKPQIVQQYTSAGVPQRYAQEFAEVDSYKIAEQSVNEVKAKANGSNLILPIGLAALMFL